MRLARSLLILQVWTGQFQAWWGTDGETLENYLGHLQRDQTVTKE